MSNFLFSPLVISKKKQIFPNFWNVIFYEIWLFAALNLSEKTILKNRLPEDIFNLFVRVPSKFTACRLEIVKEVEFFSESVFHEVAELDLV